jgi:hypothetical protein
MSVLVVCASSFRSAKQKWIFSFSYPFSRCAHNHAQSTDILLPACLSVRPSVWPSVHLFVCLSVCPSVLPSVLPSVCLPLCLSVSVHSSLQNYCSNLLKFYIGWYVESLHIQYLLVGYISVPRYGQITRSSVHSWICREPLSKQSCIDLEN